MVDQAGLNTWKVDATAMVQAAGGRWRPLKDLLAMQNAAAKYADQQDPHARPSVALPLVPPPPRVEKDRTPTTPPSGVLPLVPPPTRTGKLRPPTPRPPAPAPVAAPVIEEPNPVLEEPNPVLEEPALVLEEPAPLIVGPDPVPVAEEPIEPSAVFTDAETQVDEGPPIDPADFRAEEELAPLPEALSRGEESGRAGNEPPNVQAWDDEPLIFTNTASEATAAGAPEDAAPEEEIVGLPQDTAARTTEWDPEPSQWPDVVEEPAVVPQPRVQSLADDPVPHHSRSNDAFSHGGSRSYTSRPSEAQAPASSYVATEPGFQEDDEDFLKPRPIVLDPSFLRIASAVGLFLSRSLDVLDRVYQRLRDLYLGQREKMSEAQARRAAARAARPEPVAPVEPRAQGPVVVEARPEPPHVPLLAVADEVSDVRRDDSSSRPVSTTANVKIVPLKPLEPEGPPRVTVGELFERLKDGASARAASLRGRVDDLVHRSHPTPVPKPASSEPPTLNVSYAPPPELVKPSPPTPTNAIPVLRLAKFEDEEEPQDLYEEPIEESRFPTVWLWTKRLAWLVVLAGVGLAAHQGWESWYPKATTLSNTAFTRVSQYAQTREAAARQRQALQEATEQLPHLAPDTIRLVLTSVPDGALDPPELFQVASNAADRGLPLLPDAERREMKVLRVTLLHQLNFAERESLLAYDEVRARRTPFPFEDKGALELFARAARGLDAQSRERFQVLSGKAVIAGLGTPIADPGPQAPR